MNPLTVLIVNRSMHAFSGTELYVRDVAIGLQKQNHRPVVFTPEAGSISNQLIAAGIRVVDDIDQLDHAPDVIHGHHAWTTLAVLVRFPGTPAIFVGHDTTAWTDTPLRMPQVRRYIAVDHALHGRFSREHLIPQSKIRVIPNAIDFERFPRRGPLPERPQRALLFSNYSGPREREEIQAACDARGITLDAVGRRFGNMTSRPEELYSAYDLVFAKGRCVLEAAGVGAAVVYCDTWGCGPMLSGCDLDRAQGILAGRHLLAEPLDRQVVLQRIDSYDPAEALHVSNRIRAMYDSASVVSQLVSVYREAIAEYPDPLAPNGPDHSGRDLARHLIWWSRNAEEIFRQHQTATARLLPDESASPKALGETRGRGKVGAVFGQGWYPPQRDSRGEYCWIGPDPMAWVDLEIPENGATHLRCQVAHAMDAELMRGLVISINGQPSEKNYLREGEPVIWARIPLSVSLQPGTRLRATFTLPKTIRPSETTPASRDHRLLGIAFRHITLEQQGPKAGLHSSKMRQGQPG